MSCLVNPTGWRLYFSKYWKSNYHVPKALYPLSVHTTRLLYAVVKSILSRFHTNLYYKKNLFWFSTFKILLFHNTIFLLIKYKFHWKGYSRESFFQRTKRITKVRFVPLTGFRRPRRNRRARIRRRKLWLHRSTLSQNRPLWRKARRQFFNKVKRYLGQQAHDSLIRSERKRSALARKRALAARRIIRNPVLLAWRRRRLLFPTSRTALLQRKAYFFKKYRLPRTTKKLLYFLHFLPIFSFLKEFFSSSLGRVVPSHPSVRTIFYGLNKKNFNISELFDLVNFYLNRRRFSTIKTLYTMLKVLRHLKRRQRLAGFKFLLAGRFNRRDRATYLWKSAGAVRLGSRLSNVEYYTFPMFLNYSKCIAKIWICRR